MMTATAQDPNPSGTFTDRGIPYVLRPGDAKVEDLERLLPAPTRIKGGATLHNPESFVAYVAAFSEPGTVIFYNRDTKTFHAALDYHIPNSPYKAMSEKALPGESIPSWSSHSASLTLRETPEWKAWVANSGRKFTQVEFGRFIEEHVADIPDGYALEAIAINLQVKKSVEFSSGQRLNNGTVQFAFSEDVSGTSCQGTMEIPLTFALVVRPFEGGETQSVLCRFCYRLQDRTLSLWYELVQVDRVIAAATDQISDFIKNGTRVPVLAGELA
jgi:uncharacterized protein YfdQ (DUF2303 family)